jgi:hypothetical protein
VHLVTTHLICALQHEQRANVLMWENDQRWSTEFGLHHETFFDTCTFCCERLQGQLVSCKARSPDYPVSVLFTSTGVGFVGFRFFCGRSWRSEGRCRRRRWIGIRSFVLRGMEGRGGRITHKRCSWQTNVSSSKLSKRHCQICVELQV